MLDATRHDTAATPSDARVFQALVAVADELGERYAYWHKGAYHFTLALDGWTIALTPESADRFRIEACRFGVPTSTLWSFSDDLARLAAVVVGLAREVRVLSATT